MPCLNPQLAKHGEKAKGDDEVYEFIQTSP